MRLQPINPGEQPLSTAALNDEILYQPDESPPPLAALGHGFQNVVGRLAAMAATTAIVAQASDQSQDYLAWIFFTSLVICGLAHIAQTYRVWRFGSGYPISVVTATAFIAVSTSTLLAGGPALLSTLIAASALIQFGLISQLSKLRRIITPAVSGTVLMLLAATVISVVLARVSDNSAGSPPAAAPTIAAVTLVVFVGLKLFASPAWQQWAPVIAILAGCVVAAPFDVYDFQKVANAPWIGIPTVVWPGFDLSFNTTFWALLPGFIFVNLATTVNSISETVAIQQVAWRRPRAPDFRVVQGAHNILVLANLLAAFAGTLPTRIGSSNSARIILTGVAARRVGVFGGAILIATALSPKLISVIGAIPRPVLVAYILVMVALLFVQGMRTVFQDGIDSRKSTIVGISLWLGIGFQNQLIFPDLLNGPWKIFLSDGMTIGAICVIALTTLMELTTSRRKRLKVELGLSALPKIDRFLLDLATSAGWNKAAIDRLRSAGEETLSSLLPILDDQVANTRHNLIVSARRGPGRIELEFAAASEEENIEDRLAFLSDEPGAPDDRDFSFRLLRHYASSVQHRKYHNVDIITVAVDGPG